MKKHLIIISILLIAFLSACNLSLAEDITPPPGYVAPTAGPTQAVIFPSTPASPERGKLIYAEKCEACHGEFGLGNGPQAAGVPVPVSAIGLRDIASQYNPAKWYKVITQGQIDRYMPPFNSLTNNEKWDVLSYVYTLSNPSDLSEKGAMIYASQCASCHGINGIASEGQLSGSVVDFSDQAFMSQVTGLGLYQAIANGVQPGMQAFGDILSQDEIWALTAYLRTLTYDLTTSNVSEPEATSTPQSTVVLDLTPTIESTVATPVETSGSTEIVPDSTLTVTDVQTSTPEITEIPVDTDLLGRVFGSVVNGSGGTLPENLEVVLHGYVDMQESIILKSEINSDGKFDFTDVPLEPGMAILVTTDIGGSTYNSDFAVYDGSANEFELSMTIYDTTTDTSSISADRAHIFFDFSNPGLIQVIEIYILSNSSNQAVVAAGPDKIVQDYILPSGASNLVFETGNIGNPYIATENGFGDPSTILPGTSTYQMMYAFEIPYEKKLTIDQPLTMPVGSVIVMAPAGIKLRSDQLSSSGSRELQGQTYSTFIGENFAKGDTISLEISGKADNSTSSSNPDKSKNNLIIGLGIFGFSLILAGLFIFLKGRADHQLDLDEDEEDESDIISDDPDALMDAINSLDDQFKDGFINEEAYRVRRETLKTRLKEIL